MLFGRAVSNDPRIHLCKYVITGGDPALGIVGTSIDNSIYFMEADVDNPRITEISLKFETSTAPAVETTFCIANVPVSYSDSIEYGPEMRTTAHLYGDVLKCEFARFKSNNILVGDTIKIFNKPITGGAYSLEYTDLVKTVDSETQITLSGGTGITGVTRAYSINPYIYDIVSILPDDEYNYIVINTRLQYSSHISAAPIANP